ncbi:uncharacterized protein A1O9_05288 [Exophiala aquamarina CBS 119918]|uniref:1-alkyl-2-acetylglycerophosphocholine esterase n=1 Tax=Exophiala aquamarina CBS 119918 TaxID=1182545 RepID=A0A072PBZ7_9EURO|nr:uncharacterized protein A1O9_05288 [Exophiala aquamarina CBS 119918]KEF57371.1 hypothetical protein A1O9_05288 [Exophiala aquamarina CBS 119918]
MQFSSTFFSGALLVHIACAAVAPIPPPPGPYGVALQTAELVNTGMTDPFAPSKENRRIVVSAFYPTSKSRDCRQSQTPYMPPATAYVYDQLYGSVGLPNGTFETLALTLCSPNATMARRKHTPHPVVLFSPGLGNSRLIYNSIAATLAAQGFVVLTVDHPYDGAIVEFPDGSFVLAANITNDEQIQTSLDVRSKDMLYVKQQLHSHTVTRELFNGLYGYPDLGKAFLFGHSLGGATAAAAMLEDRKILAGINLDGTFFGDVIKNDLDRPFMIYAHEGKNLSTDQSWADTWSHLRSSKLEVTVRGSAHGSYTDFPLLLEVLGLRDQLPAEVSESIGAISGTRMLDILSTSIAPFFRFAGCQNTAEQLKRTLSQVLEMETLNSTFVYPHCNSHSSPLKFFGEAYSSLL